jgi:hypothetical protein
MLQIREKLAREKLKDPLFLRYLSRMFRVAGVLKGRGIDREGARSQSCRAAWALT